MSTHVIWGSRMGITGRVIGRILNCAATRPGGMEYKPDVIVNWGHSGLVRYLPNEEWINHRDAVGQATDKLNALQVMSEAGVPVPEFGTRLAVPDGGGPVYGRTRYHFGGRGLWYCQNYRQFLDDTDAEYWVRAITGPRKEYRIHVGEIGGEYQILFRQRKFYDGSDEQPQADADRVRNFGNGWRFSSIASVNRPTARAARRAVSSLGLTFGAVDVVRSEGGDAFVLEVNTAPAVGFRNTIVAYARFFERRLAIDLDDAQLEDLIQEVENG